MSELIERIAGGEAKLKNIEERFERHERYQNNCFERIEERLEKIEANLNSRPSWTVSVLITFLSSLCVGLLVYLVRGGG